MEMNLKIIKLGVVLMELPYPFGDVVRRMAFEHFARRNENDEIKVRCVDAGTSSIMTSINLIVLIADLLGYTINDNYGRFQHIEFHKL